MRRIAIVGGIWILLFAATVGFSLLRRNGSATASSVTQSESSLTDQIDDVLRQLAQRELAAMPRKHNASGALGSAQLRDQEFDAELHKVIIANQDRFRSCTVESLSRMKRPNEYFEISFLPIRAVDGSRMDDVVFERTTLAFTAAEERCMSDVFRGLRFESHSPRAERTFYELCFNRPPANSP